MAIRKMSASFFAFILIVFTQQNSEASPMRAYDGVPSGTLHPISGAVPVSVPRRRLNVPDNILREIRHRVDKMQVNQLDSSIRDDILQEALAPGECIDMYGIRDGILKHFIRGVRDIGGALVKDFEALTKGILKDLPLVPNVINGAGEAVTYVICGVEDVFSDVAELLDGGEDIVFKAIVDILDLEGSAPLANVPAAIVNLTELAAKSVPKIAGDLVYAVEEGVEDLAIEVKSGVKDVVKDVVGVVSGVETEVTNVVSAAGSAVQMIGKGVGEGVGNIVGGVKGALGDVLNIL